MIEKRNQDEPRVLSFGQERLWYLDQLAPNNPVYNTAFVCRLRGNLDVVAFQRALDAVLDRHEVLRTVFLSSNGAPVPFVVKNRRVDLKLIDLRHLAEPEREGEARRIIKHESSLPFNLARDLMSRPFLFRLLDQEFLFLYVTHHIVFEGGSFAVLFRDLASYYEGFVSGVPPRLPELNFDYSDFAAWQRNSIAGRHLESLSEYWKLHLAGARSVDLPLDYPRPAVHTMRGAKHFFAVPRDLVSAASTFFDATGTTAYRGLYAAFNVFLHCYSGLADICVGSPCAPRCRGTENLIGFFVNTLVLRMDLSGDLTFRRLIRRANVVVHRAIACSDLPFHKIVDAVRPPRDASRTPLFQINFRVLQEPYPTLQLCGITAEPIELVDNGTSKFDLALEIGAFVGQASYFEYYSDVLKLQTIVQMERNFVDLLWGLIAEPDIPLSQVNVIAEISHRIRQQVHR